MAGLVDYTSCPEKEPQYFVCNFDKFTCLIAKGRGELPEGRQLADPDLSIKTVVKWKS